MGLAHSLKNYGTLVADSKLHPASFGPRPFKRGFLYMAATFSKLAIQGFRIILIAILICMVCTGYVIYRERRFTKASALPAVHAPSPSCNPQELAIVGDSWVGHPKVGEQLQKLTGLSVNSYSYSGAKSRAILEDVINNSALFTIRPCTCFVIAGTNDTLGHVGSDFYAYHMSLLAHLLIANNIHPDIVSVPDYDIAHSQYPLPGTIKHVIFRTVFDRGEDNVLAKYRKALQDTLTADGSADQVDLLAFSADYRTDYKPDNIHLNESGDEKLGSVLAQAVQTYNVDHSTHRAGN